LGASCYDTYFNIILPHKGNEPIAPMGQHFSLQGIPDYRGYRSIEVKEEEHPLGCNGSLFYEWN
jgi:hypothetical protein